MTRKQNKTATLILALVVIGIWGIFIFRLYNNTEEEQPTPTQQQFTTVAPSPERRAVYTITPYARDPFLGKRTQTKKQRTKPQLPPPPAIKWPSISYLGELSSTKGKRYLIRVNNETVVWEVGKEYKGMQLLLRGKELVVKQQGETKHINPAEK